MIFLVVEKCPAEALLGPQEVPKCQTCWIYSNGWWIKFFSSSHL